MACTAVSTAEPWTKSPSEEAMRLPGGVRASMETWERRSYDSEELRRFAAKIRKGMDYGFTSPAVAGVSLRKTGRRGR